MALAKKRTVRQAPHPWAGLLAGSTLLIAASVLCVMLIADFLRNRPVDLVMQSNQLAGHLDELLITNHVPRENVRRAPAVMNQDDAAVWHSFDYDVDVPRIINANGLARLLRQDMEQRDLVVRAIVPGDGSAQSLDLYKGPRRFATVRLHDSLPEERQKSDLSRACIRIADEVEQALAAAALPPENIHRLATEKRQNDGAIWTMTQFSADLSASSSPESVSNAIKQAMQGRNVTVTQATPSTSVVQVAYEGYECVEIQLAKVDMRQFEPAPVPPPIVLPEIPLIPREGGARMAIILDDGGYRPDTTTAVLKLDPRYTLAILPDAPLTTSTAQTGKELGFEIMLHMPMQSADKRYPGHIQPTMTQEQIATITAQCLAQVPGVSGINNHTGSVFTSDVEGMRKFLEFMETQPLYFVDSRTTSKSCAYEVAQEMGIPSASRQVFLDNDRDPAAIRKQVRLLMQYALKHGTAIGIGHFYSSTAAVLAEMTPEFEKVGIELVHVSELVH